MNRDPDQLPLCLTEAEIVSATQRVRRSSQALVLQQMGIPHKIRPDGTIAVDRLAYQLAMGLPAGQAMRQARQPQVRTEGLNSRSRAT